MYRRDCMINEDGYLTIPIEGISNSDAVFSTGCSNLSFSSEAFVQCQGGQGFPVAGTFFP